MHTFTVFKGMSGYIKYELRKLDCLRKLVQIIPLSFVSLAMISLLCTEAFSASEFGDVSYKKQNCMLNIKTLPEYTTLPKLNKSQISEWGKSNKNDVVLPKHDFIYVSKEDVLSHIAITYYFDSISRQGFVKVNSGIADDTDWYGSFYLDDEVTNCINLLKGDGN